MLNFLAILDGRESVEKLNPYHDSKGKFCPKSGAHYVAVTTKFTPPSHGHKDTAIVPALQRSAQNALDGL